MGTEPILSQQFLVADDSLGKKSLTVNEIIKTHKIAAIIAVAVTHCERSITKKKLGV